MIAHLDDFSTGDAFFALRAAELSAQTFCIFQREFSSFRRTKRCVRPPISATISAVLADEVHASQVEMPRGPQHVAVVCIDLLKAMLLGARQM